MPRKESMADIKVSVGTETDIVVERLSATKDIDINQIWGSGRVFPDSYSINQVSYQGQMELQGNRLDLEAQLFDDNGLPVEFEIVLTHFDGSATTFTGCLATNEGWEGSAGETTTTTFEYLAHRKQGPEVTDSEP